MDLSSEHIEVTSDGAVGAWAMAPPRRFTSPDARATSGGGAGGLAALAEPRPPVFEGS